MLEKLFKRIAKGLNKHNIKYMIVGGQAVLLYGEPRLTKDIDITLGIGPEDLEAFLPVVKEIDLQVLVEDTEKFVHNTFVLPTLDERSGFRVDFIFSISSYERNALGRVRSVKIGNTEIYFASVEDLIIHKVIAGRPRDIEDIKVILIKNKGIDNPYILKWLKEFNYELQNGFMEVFKKLLKEIDKDSTG